MNKTKKLTQGAMMLAIVGALILIDRMTAFWFTELIVLMMPVVLIMYSSMHSFNDGLVLAVGLIIISFLLGNFQFIYLIYVPVGILTGLAYSYGISKNLDKNTLLIIAVVIYTIGEIIATFIVYPLLGYPLVDMLNEFKTTFDSYSFLGTSFSNFYDSIGINFEKLIVILYIVSTILLGIMEGVLIHILSVFMLKRFKIKDLGNINIYEIKPNKYIAYLSFLSLFLLFLNNRIGNETLQYVVMTIPILGTMVLLYYAYIFLILFGSIVLKKNVGAFIMMLAFFIPGAIIALLVVGFLYGVGPLRTYLEKKVGER